MAVAMNRNCHLAAPTSTKFLLMLTQTMLNIIFLDAIMNPRFVHADIHSDDFDGKCIADGSKLEEINLEIPPIKCPRCNRDLIIGASAPLADLDSTSAQ
jgi:hypothetical protein